MSFSEDNMKLVLYPDFLPKSRLCFTYSTRLRYKRLLFALAKCNNNRMIKMKFTFLKISDSHMVFYSELYSDKDHISGYVATSRGEFL